MHSHCMPTIILLPIIKEDNAKSRFFRKFGLNFQTFFSEMTIFMYRTSISFTLYTKYNSTANNAELVSKNTIFGKFGIKL